ncbi:MAG: hypothetical protein GWN58_65940 [Anaerolineae bacterium]|nr:hypothetical protein [Anaerolineae bacterium]
MTLRKLANGWSAMLVGIVANVAPWLAPLPTAWLVYDRTMLHLGWPQWVAIVAGVTLELLGVGILATALELYNYNGSKRKSDPTAPLWLALVLVALYFVTALMLTIALDIAPVLALVAPALFPVLSVASFALLALRADHERRLSEIEQGKAEARAKREQKKRERERADQPPSNPHPFACSICGARFDSQAALNGHQNKHRTKEGA